MSLRRNGLATVAGGTPTTATIAGLDLNNITPEMTIHFGSQTTVEGDGFVIATVVPSGVSGGEITTYDPMPVGASQPVIIDTRAYSGTQDGLTVASAMRLFNLLEEMTGVGTVLAGNKSIYLTKGGPTALANIRFRQMVGGVAQDFFEISQRQKSGTESLVFARSADGSSWSDVMWFARNSDAIQFGSVTFTGLLNTPASTALTAGLRVPHGAAPTAPVNGDFWSTTAGFFGRIAAATHQFLTSLGGAITDATQSTSPTTGALRVAGGVGVAKTVQVGEHAIARAFATSVNFIMNDDTAISFSPNAGGVWTGAFILTNNLNPTTTTANGLYRTRVGSAPDLSAIAAIAASDVVLTTGIALTGAAGTDGKFTISAHTDGKLYLENRTGSPRTMNITFIGG